MELSLKESKLIVTFLIGFIALISVLAPLYVLDKNQSLFGVGNMCASGVLLAAGLTHQLADATKTLNEDDGFPWAEFITGLTFISLLLLEETVYLLFSKEKSIEEIEENPFASKTHHSYHDDPKCGKAEGYKCDDILNTICDNNNPAGERCKISEISRKESNRSNYSSLPPFVSIPHSNDKKDHHHCDHLIDHLQGSLITSIILMLALSIHSFMEGLAVGVSKKSDALFSLTSAIFAHKAFAGYALGSSMVASGMNRSRHFVLGLTFSISTPVGIVLGVILGSTGEDYLTATLQAMVAGTFLYVSIVEIGMKELLSCRQPIGMICSKRLEIAKLVAFLLGYLAMAYLALYV